MAVVCTLVNFPAPYEALVGNKVMDLVRGGACYNCASEWRVG